MFLKTVCTVASVAASTGILHAEGTARGAPAILIPGDSQLTFGAGEAFLDVLASMEGSCGLDAGATTGVIDVRSSAITSWTGASKSAKGAICDLDPKWKVNAGAYGTLSQGENPYVQIGKGAQFQFCRAGMSPLQAQDNIEAAFAKADSHCTFVPGFTPETIAENQGNAANFRRGGSGKVTDPYHPTEAGARDFLKLRRGALCAAIGKQLGGS